MFHTNNDTVRSLLLKGNFGLEKESLRITGDGSFALSLHPFPDNKNIVYDFCENQTEINAETEKQGRALKDSERFDVIDHVVLDITAHQNEYIENPEDMKLIFLDYAQL